MLKEMMRQKKLNELNRILPMVRQTIKKQIEIDELQREINRDNNNLSTKKLNMPKEIKDKYVKKRYDTEIELLELRINANEEKLGIIMCEVRFETELYEAIIHLISSIDGIIKKEEIQEEYINEYLYLLTSMPVKLPIKKLFVNIDARYMFYQKFYQKYPKGEKLIESLEKMERDSKELFFRIYKE